MGRSPRATRSRGRPRLTVRHDTERELATLLERTLRREALANERRIGAFRALVLVLAAAFDSASYLFPRAMLGVASVPSRLPMVTVGLAAYALVVFAVVRRGWYPAWVRTALPLLDAGIILAGFANARSVLGDEVFQQVGGLATIAAACALLALGGGLRLSRTSAIASTASALAVYTWFAVRLEHVTHNLGIQLVVLAVSGLAGMWIGSIVRRATASAVAQATLGRFLPPDLVDRAYRDPLSLLTAPKSMDATVLVSDLRGFTRLTESMAPPDVLEFLSEVQGRLAAAVRDHGGTVDKFMGDGMLAVFGAPEPLDGHAAAALRAARAMFAAIDDVNARRRAAGHPETRLGVGVQTGPVVSGCLGSGARLEFTVLGDTVNTASRLQDLTKEMDVALLAGERTVREAGAAAEGLVPRGEVAVRGRAAPLRVHSLDPDSRTPIPRGGFRA